MAERRKDKNKAPSKKRKGGPSIGSGTDGLNKPAQDSEYRNLLNRVESRKDAAKIKKIAARIDRENP